MQSKHEIGSAGSFIIKNRTRICIYVHECRLMTKKRASDAFVIRFKWFSFFCLCLLFLWTICFFYATNNNLHIQKPSNGSCLVHITPTHSGLIFGCDRIVKHWLSSLVSMCQLFGGKFIFLVIVIRCALLNMLLLFFLLLLLSIMSHLAAC